MSKVGGEILIKRRRTKRIKLRGFDLGLGMQRAARSSHAGCLPVSAASAAAAVAARNNVGAPAIILRHTWGCRGKYYIWRSFRCRLRNQGPYGRNSAVGPSPIPKIDEKCLLCRRPATAVMLVFDGRRPKIYTLGPPCKQTACNESIFECVNCHLYLSEVVPVSQLSGGRQPTGEIAHRACQNFDCNVQQVLR